MKLIAGIFLSLFFVSCWKKNSHSYIEPKSVKVWGSRPLYSALPQASTIFYTQKKRPVVSAGNIYAKGNFIYQVDIGRGIHVVDNTVASQAERIGFITVNGCAQLSMKGNYIYTNSYADLVTIDVSDTASIKEVNRIANAFPEFKYTYPMAQPSESGYYECPHYDSVVIGWVKDSVYQSCYKQ